MKRRSFLKGLPVTVAATMAVAKSVGQEPELAYPRQKLFYAPDQVVSEDMIIQYDEYQKVWREKLAEHKRYLEHAFLFGA